MAYLPDWELLPWIDESNIDLGMLSTNPSAIEYLEANPDKIDWSDLSRNPAAIHLLEKNFVKIDWCNLSRNPEAIHLLETNKDKLYWTYIARNPNAENLIKNNLTKIGEDVMRNPTCFHYCVDSPDEWFDETSGIYEYVHVLYVHNKSDAVFNMLYNRDKYISSGMCANPLVIQYINNLDDLDERDWTYLSKNPAAIHILEANLDKVNWWKLSKNPSAIGILEANREKIEWYKFSANPGIFQLAPKSEIASFL